jgi:hypothetical protein
MHLYIHTHTHTHTNMMTTVIHNFVTEQRLVVISYNFIMEKINLFFILSCFLVVLYRRGLQIEFQHLVATNGRLSYHSTNYIHGEAFLLRSVYFPESIKFNTCCGHKMFITENKAG